MSMFDDLMGGNATQASDLSQGYDKAISTYEEYLGKINDMFAPYIQQGQYAGNQLQGLGDAQYNQYMQMMGMGPGGTGNWMTQYTASPWAQYQTDVGMQAANASAAASGMLGSGNNQRETATMAEDIASKDRQQYYEDMMGMGRAASSNYDPLFSTGANMMGQLGGYTYDTGQSIGKAYIGQSHADATKDAAYAQDMGHLMGMAAGAATGGMSGGGWW